MPVAATLAMIPYWSQNSLARRWHKPHSPSSGRRFGTASLSARTLQAPRHSAPAANWIPPVRSSAEGRP